MSLFVNNPKRKERKISMYSPPRPGLYTAEAFGILIKELTVQLELYRMERGRNWRDVIRSSVSSRSHHTTISWISYLVLLAESLLIFSLYVANYGPVWRSILPEAFFMLLLVVSNTGIIVWENYKRLNELPVKIEKTMATLKGMVDRVGWDDSHYPDLYMPYSPCISMQWCYRDGQLVNLPWAFLVPGDLVILLPAQKIIAKCHLVNNEEKVLEAGTTYVPPEDDTSSCPEAEMAHDEPDPEQPRLHVPLESNFAVVLEAPYVQMVRMSLQSFLKRPRSFLTKERHEIMTRIVECILLPLGLMIFVAVCSIRLFYLPLWLGIRIAPWTEILILQPIVNTFPLIPVALPFIYVLLHCIGNAKIYTLFNLLKNSKKRVKPDEEEDSARLSYHVDLTLRSIYPEVWEFFRGRDETLHRSQKLLHVLATVTALVCVDKKGILSWPNPTADKVFFLRTKVDPATKKREVKQEILDVTHDNRNAFELHFDDTTWEAHLSTLKPIGLNILLNNCNYQTRATYSSFHTHITHELQSNGNDLVVPVTSRRCLCELARIIGFVDKATDVFKLEQELCSYRHIESDEFCRGKLNRAKIKFPFPHMMSVIVREKIYQSLQLMSQGTGDMILDVCDDFWDGTDLRPLNEEEKKLILDFYQRSSLTSVCAAFAYKPIQAKVNNHLASLYMELPPSKGARYLPYYALGDGTSSSHIPPKDASVSSDCLLNLAEKRRGGEKEVSNVDGCYNVQTNQIFLGMVAMQYEACMDMVQLIEQLETACVRFVHFSKENELRSRLFSEKMGLESGWNCHISLRPLTEEEKLEEEREERELHMGQCSSIQRSSDQAEGVCFFMETETKPVLVEEKPNRRPTLNELLGMAKRPSLNENGDGDLARCSASVPAMVSLARHGPSDLDQEPEEAKQLLPSGGLQHHGDQSDDDADSEIAIICGPKAPLKPRRNHVSCGDHSSSSSSDNDSSTDDSMSVKSLPVEEPAFLRKKESIIRFADSVNLQDGKGLAAGKDSAFNLKVGSGKRQSTLTPTESYSEAYEMAENKTPLGFDMSNRAKLPRGIEEMRPHLENVDNVPLLVSLFTDCTAESSREMIKIMQDYGEVILLLGSSCNHENPGLFLQADASIALEPLYPQACHKHELFVPPPNGRPSPTEVAMLLTSLPSAVYLKRNDQVSFYHLIAHSRHFVNNCIRNSLQFWLSCQVAVTVLGLMSLLALLPPLFTIGDAMWLSCFVIPILALTLSFATMDRVESDVMEIASTKNQVTLDKSVFIYALYFYGMKFLLSLINVTIMAGFNLRWICDHLENMNHTCSWVYPVMPSILQSDSNEKVAGVTSMKCITSWGCGDNADKLLFVQQYSVFFLVLYFIIISACFVYRNKYIWYQNPIFNQIWLITSVVVLMIQCIYGALKLRLSSVSFDLLPWVSFVWAFLWAPVVLGLNELIRRQEIKLNIRYQKRARLDYGTKLGMNSPF